jgi:hypothetical protein
MLLKKIIMWLEKMAERNEKNLGNRRLDCCNLNHQKNSSSVRRNPVSQVKIR